MDLMHAVHLLIFGLIMSIPVWPIAYLKFGVYVPLTISTVWVMFNGCPLTQAQTNLSSNSFTKEVYKSCMPNISVKYAEHINTFALLLITVVGFYRLQGGGV
jgi:hypothetical protein